MSIRNKLFKNLGGDLSDSVGVREGESTLPTYVEGGSKPPRANFVRSRDVGEMELTEIIPDPDQPRKEFDEDEIQRLGKSIESHGLLQPIRVRWSEVHDKWVIVAGERRWRAHKAIQRKKIKCVFDDSGTDMTTIRSQSIIENVLREDLTGMELARSLKSLMDDNSWSAAKISQELHISKGKVSKALALLKLPEEIQLQVEQGKISPATGYQLSKVKNKEKQQQLASQAVVGKVMSVDAAQASKRQQPSGSKTRRTTNETFRTADKVKVVISSRRDIGQQGMINALLEVADEIRKRTIQKKAA